jgi:hypothetical protein
MGRTYTRNKGYKKDRRDIAFKKSKKFKHWSETPHHKINPSHQGLDVPPVGPLDHIQI